MNQCPSVVPTANRSIDHVHVPVHVPVSDSAHCRPSGISFLCPLRLFVVNPGFHTSGVPPREVEFLTYPQNPNIFML